MADRQYFWLQNNTEQNTSETSYQDAATLTFTPDASSNYMVYVCFNMRNSDAGYVYARLYDDTGSAVKQESIIQCSDSTERPHQHFMVVFSSGASPTSQSFKLQFKADSGLTMYIDQINFLILRLDAGDVFASSTGESVTTTVGTLYAKVTVAAGATGYFTNVASATLYTTSAGSGVLLDTLLLYNTTGSTPLDRWSPRTTSERITMGGHRIDNVASAAYNLGILYRLYAGSQLAIKDAWVVGLKMNNFNDYGGGEQDTGITTNATTLTESYVGGCYRHQCFMPMLAFLTCSYQMNTTSYYGTAGTKTTDEVTDYHVAEDTLMFQTTGELRFCHSMTIFENGYNHWTEVCTEFCVSNASATLTKRYEKAVFFELNGPETEIEVTQDGTHIDIDWQSKIGA
jgi:hypothetical protein